MKLFHDSELIGTIYNVETEGFWLSGDLSRTPASDKFMVMFNFLTDEEHANEEPPFPEADLNGWYIEDEKANMRPIFAPAVHDNGTTIAWRWTD